VVLARAFKHEGENRWRYPFSIEPLTRQWQASSPDLQSLVGSAQLQTIIYVRLSMSQAATLFEQELTRRRIGFRRDAAPGRYVVDHEGLELFVSLDNLTREFARDPDAGHIKVFVDSVLSPRGASQAWDDSWDDARASILFCFEPSDFAEPPPLRNPISRRVDRVPVHFDTTRNLISWITPNLLRHWDISFQDLEHEALQNLANALDHATVEHDEIDGMRLGYLGTTLPFKTALILAPNFKDIVAPLLGWPLCAVMPDRDFLYLWDSRHADLVGRVGRVVVNEFSKAPYPISTEVFEVSDSGIKAIGAFAEPGR
jgi:hypothetical protein